MKHLIKPYLEELQANFKTQRTKSAAWRKQQLMQLLKGITEMKKEM